jgi:D-glycero-D-manno-heptose 1,7-bisphosphate phosphatase
MLHPAVFLDRDGTLIHDTGYLGDPALVRVLPGIPAALSPLKAAGFLNVIITNQSGIGRGLISESDFHRVQTRLIELLGPGLIDATFFCPDHADAPGHRRKPAPGMVIEAAQELDLDPACSWFIGDKAIDVQCGRNAGTRSILVLSGEGSAADGAEADFVAKDLAAAVAYILEHSDASP